MGVEENLRTENTMKTIRTHLRKTSADTKILSEEDVKLLKDRTEMEENEIVEKHDSFLEKHPDGNISKKSFDQLLSECFTKSSRKKLRSHLWRIYDLNMDAVVRDLMAVEKSNHNSPLIAKKAWEEMSPAEGGEISVEDFTTACLANKENTARIIMKVISLFLDH